jgi:hypothetical protein
LLLGYALAKELDDLGEGQAAFAALATANAEHRARLPYRFASDAANFDAIERTWPLLAGVPAQAPPQDAPIFVIGMPRTGTTLVDRILSSHPGVESAGELQAMPLAVKQAAGTRSRTVLDPETMAALAQADLGAVGMTISPAPTTTGAIRPCALSTSFPAISTMWLHRPRAAQCPHRLPAAPSDGHGAQQFPQSLRDHLALLRLQLRSDGHRALLRPLRPADGILAAGAARPVLELSYEDLVADQEGQTRRLLDHCGLAWNAACLDFHRNAAPVSTPSAAQVRRPLYRDALARWKRHEAELAEVAAYLPPRALRCPRRCPVPARCRQGAPPDRRGAPHRERWRSR